MHYDPESGVFTWKITTSPTAPKGSVAGTNKDGYIVIRINRQPFYAHRLAVFFMTGKWPEGEVDHINGNRGDNRWVNLRDVSSSQNKHNQERKGSYFRKSRGHWESRITVNGREKYLGSFKTKKEADAVYKAAKLKAAGLGE